eukprot:ANDGO_07446.mRNA.1 Laminin subunit alpha
MRILIWLLLCIGIRVVTADFGWNPQGPLGLPGAPQRPWSMVVGPDNVTYVAFSDMLPPFNGKLHVMKFDGSDWVDIGSAPMSNSGATFTSMAISPVDNKIYVAFQDGAYQSRFSVATFNGTGWQYVGPPGSLTASGGITTIGVNKVGDIYALILEAATPVTRQPYVRKFNGATWSMLGTYLYNDSTEYTSLAFNAAGNPYAAFTAGTSSDGYVSRWTGSAWEILPDKFSAHVQALQLQLDAADSPYIAYNQPFSNYPGNGSYVKRWNGSDWDIVGGSFAPGQVVFLAFAIDKHGNLFVGYPDQSYSLLNRLAVVVQQWNGSVWSLVGGTYAYPEFNVVNCEVYLGTPLNATVVVGFIDMTPSYAVRPVVMQYSNITWCEPGYFRHSTYYNCSVCPAGTFSVGGSAYCTPCLAGTYSSEGASNCTVCAAGSYNSNQMSVSCTLCLVGRSSLPGSTSCTNCLSGYHSPVAGTPACLPCPSGSFASAPGTVNCTLCPSGKYSQSNSSSTCQNCVAGTYNPIVGANSSSSCLPCAAGSYSAVSASSTCIGCPAGTASLKIAANTSLTCVSCGSGSYATTNGSTVCTLCDAGTASAAIGANRSNTCQPCIPGSYAPFNGSATCAICPPGTFVNVSSATSCSPCAAGYYSSTNGTVNCESCVAGTYSAVTGANSSSICTPCAQGSFASFNGSSGCMSCPQGTFGNSTSSTSASSCYACPAGSFSTTTGSSTCTLCASGTFGNTTGGTSNASSCYTCPKGSYSPVSGSTSCTLCATGTYNNRTGATSSAACTLCPGGTFGNTTGGSSVQSCHACAPGSFSSSAGATNASTCVKCPIGSYSTSKGLMSCTLCSAGTSNNATGSSSTSACTSCSAGSYATAAGSAACTPCSAGTYNPKTGSTNNASCLLCPAGTFNPSNGSTNATSCIPCAVNSFSSSAGSATCTACSTGQCAPAVGSTSCGACTCAPGQYRVSATACAQCPAGTWQSLPDQQSCYYCPFGQTSSVVGANNVSVCTPCAVGTYPVAGSASCAQCYPGWFAPGFGNGGCSPCPAGTYTGIYASGACDACPVGTYSPTASPYCTTCSSGVSSVDRAPRCNVYNVSETALSPTELSLLVTDWQCASHQLSSSNASLAVYATWNRQAVSVESFASCNVSTFETLPTASIKGESLSLALNMTTLTSASAWFVQGAKCFVCMRGSAAGSAWIALSETEVVAENSEVLVGAIAPGQPKFVSTPSFATAGARTVEITVTVTGGTVDAYLSTSNPSPSSASWEVMQRIESTTATLSILASGPVYVGLYNPTPLSPVPVLHSVRSSGSQPTVTVFYALRSPSSPSSDGSGSGSLSAGDIAAIVLVPLVVLGALVVGVWFWKRRKSAALPLSPVIPMLDMSTDDAECGSSSNVAECKMSSSIDVSTVIVETEAAPEKENVVSEESRISEPETSISAAEMVPDTGLNEKSAPSNCEEQSNFDCTPLQERDSGIAEDVAAADPPPAAE